MKEFDEILAAYRRNMFLHPGQQPVDVMALYRALPDKTVRDEKDRTLYHTAAMFFDHEAVEYLASEGVKPRADEYGNTPLHEMARSPYTNDITRYAELGEAIRKTALALIEAGANPGKKNEEGKIAYFEAGLVTMYPFLQAMAEAGVRMDAVGNEEKNLLHMIADRYYHRKSVKGVPEASFKCVEILLASGSIDPEDKDIFGTTPLTYAQRSGAKELAALMTGDETALRTGGMTIDEAVLQDDIKALEAIIDGGGDVNELSEKKRTPLMRACEFPRPEILTLLLEKGADPNYRDGETGCTAAFYLLAYGVGNLKPINGRNPRTIVKMLHELIGAGMNVDDAVDNGGNTALAIVCMLGHTGGVNERLAEELIDRGADINKPNLEGQTPLMIYAVKGDENEFGIAELLLESGARADVVDRYSNTPLMYAAANTNAMSAKKICRLLLDTGNSQPERTNNDGKTAMDMAVERNNEAVVKLLLENI